MCCVGRHVAGLTNVVSAVGDLDAAWRGSVASVAVQMGDLPLVGTSAEMIWRLRSDTGSLFLVLCGYGSSESWPTRSVVGLPQHSDEYRPQRPILLAVVQTVVQWRARSATQRLANVHRTSSGCFIGGRWIGLDKASDGLQSRANL